MSGAQRRRTRGCALRPERRATYRRASQHAAWTEKKDWLAGCASIPARARLCRKRRGAFCASPRLVPVPSLPARPRELHACMGARDCTPEIDTSEIIVDFQWHCPTEFHFPAVFSKGWSLVQRILTGIVQWIFSGVFQWNNASYGRGY